MTYKRLSCACIGSLRTPYGLIKKKTILLSRFLLKYLVEKP